MLRNTIQLFKDSYAGHPKEIWTIAILTLINRMGTMVIPFLSVYLTTVLGYSLKEAGILASAFGFGSLVGSYASGRLIDRYGSTPIIIGSLFFSGFFFIALQWFTTFHLLWVMIFFTTAFGDAYRPAMMAAVGEIVPKSASGRTMAFFRIAINLGMAIAPLVGGFVAVAYGYKWLFWIDGATCIAASTYFCFASRNWQRQQPIKAVKPNDATTESLASSQRSPSPYRDTRYLIFLVASFFIGYAFIQWFHTIPVYIKTVWQFDERFLGLLMAVNCTIIVLIEMPIVHIIERRKRVFISTIIGILLFAGSFMFLDFSPSQLSASWLMVVGYISILLMTMGEIMVLPFNNAHPIALAPNDRRGEYTSYYWITWSIVAIVAPFSGFAFIDAFGYSAFWFFLVAILGISVLIHQYLGKDIFDAATESEELEQEIDTKR